LPAIEYREPEKAPFFYFSSTCTGLNSKFKKHIKNQKLKSGKYVALVVVLCYCKKKILTKGRARCM
jgi:hypothetical protein